LIKGKRPPKKIEQRPSALDQRHTRAADRGRGVGRVRGGGDAQPLCATDLTDHLATARQPSCPPAVLPLVGG
jgi:hypothetical protein